MTACFNIDILTMSDVWEVCERVKQFVAELDDCHSKSTKNTFFGGQTIRMQTKHCTCDFYRWNILYPYQDQAKAQTFYSQFYSNDNKFKANKGYKDLKIYIICKIKDGSQAMAVMVRRIIAKFLIAMIQVNF